MTADDILAIKTPEGLFAKDEVEKSYKLFAKEWHPDVNKNPKSNDVFIHITELYKEAIEKINSDAWGFAGTVCLKDKLGTTYKIRYRWELPFELGTMYVADSVVCYVLEEKHKKLYINGINSIDKLRFPAGKDTLAATFPNVYRRFVAEDGSNVVILHKTEDVLPLSVALNYFNGKIEPKSAAWIISCLHNTLCALKFSKLTHNDISTNTYFISPKYHTGLLLGGWWYAVPKGSKLIGVPQRSYSVMSLAQKQDKKAVAQLDAELLRLTAREILGDASGFKLKTMGIPHPIDQWVNIPSHRDAYSDYEQWSEVLKIAFGPRKFTPMGIKIKKAYEMMPRRV